MTSRRKPESTLATCRYYKGADYEPNESIGYLASRLKNSLTRAVDARMAELDLTHAQWGPLLMIHKGMGTTAAEFARLMNLDTGAVTRTVDRLEAKGLLVRQRSAEDRRVVHLQLTARGKRLAEHIPYVVADVLNEHLAGFKKSEVESLKSMLNRMLDNGQRSWAANAGESNE
ncbi:MAG TPA: MarR family transcriptional regulator [Burkholderiaceae bacterium]|nr:MarR family transcriptional regulator [Burkholderiaceae bacterium]